MLSASIANHSTFITDGSMKPYSGMYYLGTIISIGNSEVVC